MIKLIKSSFYKENETKQKLADFILKADILSMNKECSKFEHAFAKKQNRKYAVFVSSGSSANLVMIQALLNLGKLKKGDKVGFSALTWSTNVMPLIQLGLNPVALDCSLETLNISPEELEKNVSQIKGLFLTNVLGFSDDIKKIKDLCKNNNVIFLEDNCESLGSKTDGKLLGNFGLASTFSFFVGHHLSTIEGGMICTDDDELYNMLLIARIHGWDRNLDKEHQEKLRKENVIDEFYAKYTFYDLAFNARPTEINGFLGNIQLDFWDEIVSRREENFKLFQNAIEKNDDFIPLKLDHMDLVSNFSMPVICKDKAKCEKYKQRFVQNEVEVRPIIAGNIEKQPFYKKYIKEDNNCVNSNFAHKNGFYFGNNPELEGQEISLLCNLLRE
jgi:CDP-4-dehydro-6-deoxyglucose reductase, E1